MIEKIFEYIIIGPPDVGKTSITNRYIDNTFISDSYNTIGIDMKSKKLNNFYNGLNNGLNNTRINIYDTAGQERYFALTNSFIRNRDCILLCFSLANSNSFIECQKYIEIIKNYKKENSVIFLVGTFLDMKDICNNIDKQDIKDLCDKNNFKYIEISSKTGEGIRELFNTSLDMMIQRKLGTEKDTNILLNSIYNTKNRCC
jgi:small GTP-binding protein